MVRLRRCLNLKTRLHRHPRPIDQSCFPRRRCESAHRYRLETWCNQGYYHRLYHLGLPSFVPSRRQPHSPPNMSRTLYQIIIVVGASFFQCLLCVLDFCVVWSSWPPLQTCWLLLLRLCRFGQFQLKTYCNFLNNFYTHQVPVFSPF